MFCPKKSTCYIAGALEVLGPRGYWGVELIVLANPTLNSVQYLRLNHVKVVEELISVRILLLGMNCHYT